MKRTGITALLLSIVILFALLPEGQSQQVIVVMGQPYEVPYGQIESLDGNLGSGWEDAVNARVSLSGTAGTRSSASVAMKHDGKSVCFAMSFQTGTSFSGATFRPYVFFNNDDLFAWNVGDNLVIVPEQAGRLVTAGVDYHYPQAEQFALDMQQNARGAVRWNARSRTYDAEICIEMNSGDYQDVNFEPCTTIVVIIGYDVISGGRFMFEAESTPFNMHPVPHDTHGADGTDPQVCSESGCCPNWLAYEDASEKARRVKELLDQARQSCHPDVQRPFLNQADQIWTTMSQREKIEVLTLIGQAILGENVCFVVDGPNNTIPSSVLARVWVSDGDPNRVVHMTLGNQVATPPHGAAGSVLDWDFTSPNYPLLWFLCYEFEIVRTRWLVDCRCSETGLYDPEFLYDRVKSLMDELNSERDSQGNPIINWNGFYTQQSKHAAAYTEFMRRVRANVRGQWPGGLLTHYHASWLFEKILTRISSSPQNQDHDKTCDLSLSESVSNLLGTQSRPLQMEFDRDALERAEQRCECCDCPASYL